MTLHDETVLLAKRFRFEAERLDQIFINTADPKVSEEANRHREFARKLFALALEM